VGSIQFAWSLIKNNPLLGGGKRSAAPGGVNATPSPRRWRSAYPRLTTTLCLILAGWILPIPIPASASSGRNQVEIQRVEGSQLKELIAKRVSIDSVNQDFIRAWLTPSEYEWVKNQGWSVRWIPPSPEDYWATAEKIQKTVTYPVSSYPTYAELVTALQDLAAAYPNLSRLESIGKSYENRDLLFMKITDHPDVEEDEPEFKYIAAMHGNETLGVVMTLNLIELLLREYGSDDRITQLVNETEIWIMPLMNPDGYSRSPRVRDNAQGYDLNRNFPDRVDDPDNTPDGRPIEIQAMMSFAANHSTVMSANFHTGSLVVNYPYDNSFNNDIELDPDWFSPDDDVFVENSLTYSMNNPPMYASPFFENGITNGISWYVISGGMQDWNYVWPGCFEVTIEISNTFSPSVSQLSTYWNNNRESMLSYMERVHTGVRGVISDSRSGIPLPATAEVEGRDRPVFTDPDVGDYHRLLLPGTYTLTFSAAGHEPQTITGVEVLDGTATRLDMALDPIGVSGIRLW
jgi:hypothetical protein